jgi:hypothetical protein
VRIESGPPAKHLERRPDEIGLVLERGLQSNRHLLSDRRFKRRAQGHLIAPALPAAKFDEFLQRMRSQQPCETQPAAIA